MLNYKYYLQFLKRYNALKTILAKHMTRYVKAFKNLNKCALQKKLVYFIDLVMYRGKILKTYRLLRKLKKHGRKSI
jgi:hypothetical protein